MFNGLDNVDAEMVYKGELLGLHLLFDEQDVMTFNSQGFIIDPTSANPEHFAVLPAGSGYLSDAVQYNRHAFDDYMIDHLPGHIKEVDPNNPDWHKSAAQGYHVEYNFIVVAVTGKVNGRLPLTPGWFTGTVRVTSTNTE